MEVQYAVLKTKVSRERTERRAHTLSTVRLSVAMKIESIINN